MTKPKEVSTCYTQILDFNHHFPLKTKQNKQTKTKTKTKTKQNKNSKTELEKLADSSAEIGKMKNQFGISCPTWKQRSQEHQDCVKKIAMTWIVSSQNS